MQLGVVARFDGRPGRTMGDLRAFARQAEDVGTHSLWFPEHVVFFAEYRSRYPYTEDGDARFGKRPGIYDPLFAATVAASATTRVRVGTAILIVPQRNPVVLAQEVVAVDHASDGRFDFGVGIGWSDEEFAAIGVPWARRGARTDDFLDAMTTLWRDASCTHDGEFVAFRDVIAEPKPVQQPHPPLWVGGGRGAAMVRAARRGQGWYGWAVPQASIGEVMDELDRIAVAEGRDPGTLGRKLGLPWNGDTSALRAYAETAAGHGVTELVVGPAATGNALLDAVGAAVGAVTG